MNNETYAMQHFGFSAMQVTHERNHFLKTTLNKAFDSMIQKATSKEATANLLKQQKDNVIRSITSSMADELKELEALDQKYFNVPEHVLLADDFEHAKVTDEMEQELDKEIAQYKQCYLENVVMIRSLEQQDKEFKMAKLIFEKHLETKDVLSEALNVLNKNDTRHVQTLVRATKQMSNNLQEEK